MRLSNSLLAVLALSAMPSSSKAQTITATRVRTPPEIDGEVDDVWSTAPATVIRMEKLGEDEGRESDLAISAAHDGTKIYFLVRWIDGTNDDAHQPWVWNKASGEYEASDQEEDVLSLAFPIKGEFTGNMLAPVECEWDVWHWKAARTNPAGHAMDKHHVHTFRKSDPSAESFKTRSGKILWIARPEDEGDSPQKKQAAPDKQGDDMVPQYVPGKASGSAADITAKGVWKAGIWCVELARKLNTGNADDAVIEPGKSIEMAVAVFDHAEHSEHSVSGVIELVLAE